MEDKTQSRPYIKWLIRIAGTALFSWLVLRNGNLTAVIDRISRIDIYIYILLCIIFLIQHFILAIRWNVLLKAVSINSPILGLFRVILYGQVLNKLLPSSIGGDSAKVAFVMVNNPDDKAAAVSATIIDRVVGLFVLFLIVLVTLPMIDTITTSQKLSILLVFGMIVIVAVITYLGWIDKVIERVLSMKLFKNQVGKQLVTLWRYFQQYREYPVAMLKACGLSLLIKVIMILSQHYTFSVIGVRVPLLDMFFSIPLVNLATTIPISIGGLGVREASLTALLNIPADQVVSYSLIQYSIPIVIAVLVLLISLFTNNRTSRNSE